MTTINISLPEQLRYQADQLVKKGYYVSISDLVRDSIRKTLQSVKFDLLAEEAKHDEKKGNAVTLNSEKDIAVYMSSL